MRPPTHRKILPAEGLAARLTPDRAAGRTVVHCHGCFDIVHPGHIRYLQSARDLGDILIVSLTGDAAVDKGLGRPHIPQELRAENLAALEFVDWVVIDPHPTAVELLGVLKPDIYVKGREYAERSDPRFLAECAAVESAGGRVVFHSGDVVFSSTRLLAGVQRDSALDAERLATLCARHGLGAQRVHDLLASFCGKRVLVVGDLLLDRYVFADAGAAAEDAPMLSLRQIERAEFWGGAAAVALQADALGARPFLLSALGRDARSRRDGLRFVDLGVPTHFLSDGPALVRRTTLVADDSKLFRVTDGRAMPLDSAARRQAAALIRERLAETDVLIWVDSGFGVVTAELVAELQAELRASEVRIVGHAAGPDGQFSALRGADLLFGSERQFREAVHDPTSGLPAVAWNVLNRTEARAALVSLRKRGLLSLDGGATGPLPERLHNEFVPSLATHFVDTVGADDAALTTVALALASGASLPEATYLGAAAEALAVARVGRQPISRADLDDWLARRSELSPRTRFRPATSEFVPRALSAAPAPLAAVRAPE